MERSAVLYIFSGLPGVGKSSIASRLAAYITAAYLRIDTLEQGLRDLCHYDVTSEGYRIGYRLVRDNLRLGISVVADCCNPLTLTRREWQDTALEAGAEYINIIVHCSDASQHRQRVEGRGCDIENLTLPSWDDVVNREYHEWNAEAHIVIDTAGKSPEKSFRELLQALDMPPGETLSDEAENGWFNS